MSQLHRDPSTLGRIFRHIQAHKRRLVQIQSTPLGLQARLELFGSGLPGCIERDLGDLQSCPPPYDLYGMRQFGPDERAAQDVVACNSCIESLDVRIEILATSEADQSF